MLTDLIAYLFLFASAFGAASVLPFYSEPVLVGMLVLGGYSPLILWLVASAGNTAGAVLNWWMARYLLHWQHKRWFPMRPWQIDRASQWFRRYGVWTLLLAWAPVGGDALTFVAGLMRVRLSVFIMLVGIGKAGRYAMIIWATQTAGSEVGQEAMGY